MTKSITAPHELKKFLIPAFERKAKSITAIDVRKLTSYTDSIVIIEAGSQRQVTSIAQHLLKTMKSQMIHAIGFEGIKEGEWALIDYGEVIIHIFESEKKDFYDLEGLWADAKRIDLSGFEKKYPSGESDEY